MEKEAINIVRFIMDKLKSYDEDNEMNILKNVKVTMTENTIQIKIFKSCLRDED